MKFNDLKKVYNFITTEIANTKTADLVFTPNVCIVEDRVNFEVFQKPTRIGSLMIEDYYVAIRKDETNKAIILETMSRVDIKEFEEFTVVRNGNTFEVFILTNYDRENKDYLKFIALKGI